MEENQLVENVKYKNIEVQKFKTQNGISKIGLLNKTTDDRDTATVTPEHTKSDLDDNFDAPDGGWGWLVAVASGVCVLFTYPVLQQFGILFRHKFSNIGMSSSELTSVLNVQQAAAMCSGLMNGPLFRRFSHRQVALIGNFFVFSGLFLAAFANSFLAYFISISLLYGTGRGIMFSTMTVAVNTYFKEKRQEATAYQYAVAGFGPMVFPYIITFLVSYYGVTGAVLLLSGLSLHNLACSAIYQPVKLHAKKVPQSIPMKNLDISDENLNSYKPCDFSSSRLEIINNKYTTPDKSHPHQTRTEILNKLNNDEKSLPEAMELLEKPQSNHIDEKTLKKPSILKRIVEIFDLDLLKDFGYVNIVMGLTLMNIIHMNFHYLTPFILNEFGLDSSQIASAMTVEAICGFVMKIAMILIVAKIRCDTKICLLIGCSTLVLGRFLLVYYRSKIAVLLCFGWIGVGAAIVLIFWVLVLPSYVPLKKLPAAIGLQRLIMGICNIIIGPFIGLIRDATNYSCILHIMNAIIFIVTISWLSEHFYKKRRGSAKTGV